MNITADVITVNGKEYVPKDSVCSPVTIGDMRIIVADRGWVFVGNCVDNGDKSVTITNARNIRRWGTSKGLGELVNGPLSSTTHDPYGTVRCNPVLQITVIKGW